MVEPMIPIGAAIAFGLGAIGTGLAQSKIGAAGYTRLSSTTTLPNSPKPLLQALIILF